MPGRRTGRNELSTKHDRSTRLASPCRVQPCSKDKLFDFVGRRASSRLRNGFFFKETGIIEIWFPAMARLGRIALAIWLVACLITLQACAQVSAHSPASVPGAASPVSAGRDEANAALPKLPDDPAGQGRVLTDYLKSHRLPLVGAKVVDSGTGRQVILYGFVATPRGKDNAEKKVRRIINDPSVAIENRIIVKPELLTMNAPEGSSESQGGADNDILSQVASHQSYSADDQIQQYQQQQQQSNWESWIIPLLMFAPMFIP